MEKGCSVGILLCVVAMGVGGCAAPYFYKMFTHTSLNKSLENEAEITEKMEELNDYINQYYLFDYTDENVESGIYKGMMAGLGDIYTCYYTPDEYASFMESSNGNYSGIGAMLSQTIPPVSSRLYRCLKDPRQKKWDFSLTTFFTR